MPNIWFRIASLMMLAGVALGAFGAHALKVRFSLESMQIYQTAVFYHIVHALGLFVVSSAVADRDVPYLRLSGFCFIIGILIFSGSLYLLSMTGARWLGAVTPLGGVCFMVGWASLYAGR